MPNLLQRDESVYRACIYYEAICKTPVEVAYKRMKKVKPSLDFLDFDYWYYRFLNGNDDLDHDRSTDPETREFSDLPLDLVDLIVHELDLFDKLSARKVCKSMRAVIDNQSSKFQVVRLIIEESACEIRYDDQMMRFSTHNNESYLLEAPCKTISSKGDYGKAALEEFVYVISHSKWSIETCDIQMNIDTETERKPIAFLGLLLNNHTINVDSLILGTSTLRSLSSLLPFFEAASLTCTYNANIEEARENSFDDIIGMDQWKRLRSVTFSYLPERFPIEALFHLMSCSIDLVHLTEDRLVKIRDILFKSPTFEYFEFWNEAREEELGVMTDRVMSAHSAYNSDTKVYHIENTKNYIHMSIEDEEEFGFQFFRIELNHS